MLKSNIFIFLKKKMKILLINEWYSPSLQNLIYYFTAALGPAKFNWTGKRWYRKDFLPLHELEESSLISEPIALTKLQNQEYDFVIFSDSSTYVFLSSHFIKTKKIFLDFTDSSVIPMLYWSNADIYFKTQLLKEKTIIYDNSFDNNQIEIEDYENNNLYPLCLMTSYKSQTNIQSYLLDKIHDVFFVGSAWPTDRTNIMSIIKSNKEINFYGGLYNRKDLEFNNIIPDILKSRQLDTFTHKRKIIDSKICLNIRGNGCNCFRQFEILNLGSLLLTQENNCFFAHKEPLDRKHCVYFRQDGSNIIDLILYYIKNPNEIIEISKQGQQFYNDNFHPNAVTQYILQIIERYI